MTKTVLITGCSRGIGLALVKECVSLGHKVIATCRNPAGASDLKELLAKNNQPEALALDVDNYTSIKEAFEKVKALTPTLDILINNAGVAAKGHPIDPAITTDPDEMLRLYSTNVIGPMLMIRTFLPLLKNHKGDRSIVANVSSFLGSLGLNTTGGITAYRCSKAALNMLTKNFAVEIPDISFVSVHPGWVQTDMGSSNNRKPPVPTAESASGIMRLMEEFKHEDSGKLFDWNCAELEF